MVQISFIFAEGDNTSSDVFVNTLSLANDAVPARSVDVMALRAPLLDTPNMSTHPGVETPGRDLTRVKKSGQELITGGQTNADFFT
jgi:hypothetical protein